MPGAPPVCANVVPSGLNVVPSGFVTVEDIDLRMVPGSGARSTWMA